MHDHRTYATYCHCLRQATVAAASLTALQPVAPSGGQGRDVGLPSDADGADPMGSAQFDAQGADMGLDCLQTEVTGLSDGR